jgi:hydrogenase maturation factor
MSWVAHLTEKGDEKELADYLLDHCSFRRKSVAKTAAKEFIKAQKEIEECQDNKSVQRADTNTTDIQKQQR